jgi:hypothetical protein
MRRKTRESGMALATAILVLFLAAALVAGFSWLTMTDQRLGGVNGNEQFAFYGAEAGMEKLTADLGTLFQNNPSPSGAEVNNLALATSVPQLPGIQYVNPDGTLGYHIAFPPDGSGNPLAQNHTILSGPYEGMVGLLTPFTLTVVARTVTGGSEVKLQRSVQTVGIPVFQFGMFSQTDLSFFAGPNFNFGGRVHTNGNLFLAEGDGNTLTLGNKVTAVGDIIRTNLSNGWLTTAGYNGVVNVATAPGTFRALAMTEGSLTGTLGSAQNPNWPTISLSNYNGYIRNSLTGAKPLNLSIALNSGANPIDLVRRPVANENASNPSVLAQRFYSEASVRILLSDNPADITGLPCVTGTAPVNLATLTPAQLGGVPIATSAAGAAYSPANGYWTAGALVTGYLKVEVQTSYAVPPNPCGTWRDVTAEVLGLGIAGRNLDSAAAGTVAPPALPALPTAQVGASACADPSPNAIIRFERVRDNPSTGAGNPCGIGSVAPTDYWPNALFDTREGNLRDFCPFGSCNSNQPMLNGVIDYTQLDVNNLARWLTGAIGASGTLAKDPATSSNDFSVYFSDRRGNYTPAAVAGWPPASPSGSETGEYGFEDLINPASQFACPNASLDAGETLDQAENSANQAVGGAPEVYGEASPANGVDLSYPQLLPGVVGAAVIPNPNCATPVTLWPGWYVVNSMEARENVPLFFRRALKIVNGSNVNLGVCPDGVACGLTVASENPVYVQGDFNAGAGGNFGGAHVAASVVADAVTLLSNNWNDANSFACPYGLGGGVCNYRQAATTTYRIAVAAGKGISFPQPTGYATYQDFGTDGGTHNFLRMMENWGGQTLFYRGSIVSFYYNRQATGVYKCCTTVYSPPSRGYNFDSDFLTPSLLPPRTPMFRDVNTVGFSQMILPNQ